MPSIAIVDSGPLIAAANRADKYHIAALVEQYSEFPLGGTDATVVALAERLKADLPLTTDHRHFRAVRPLHCESFQLLIDEQ